MQKSVVIVGGGISGLAAANYLEAKAFGPNYSLIESSPKLGGKVSSAYESGFIVEAGPDSFMARKTAAVELCRSMGLADQLIAPSNSRTVFVWDGKRLTPMPEGVMMLAPRHVLPFLKSPLISWPGKLRMGMELFIPARQSADDESLASFVRRRLGNEALAKIAAPLLAGIFSADPETLSLASTFPMFLEMEHKHGGIVRAMWRRRHDASPKAAADGEFLTLRGGLQQLVDAIARKLIRARIQLASSVDSVVKSGERYEIQLRDGSRMHADGIVFATPAYATASMLRQIDGNLADALLRIPYVSTATVSLGFRKTDIPKMPKGSGFVVAAGSKLRITACSWSSEKFQDRAPEGSILLRVFVGGARAPELAEKNLDDLILLAREELRTTMGITAEPMLVKAYRWLKANPQYLVGHKKLVTDIERMTAAHRGIYLAGAAYHGPGIPDCIQSGLNAAREITQLFSRRRRKIRCGVLRGMREGAL